VKRLSAWLAALALGIAGLIPHPMAAHAVQVVPFDLVTDGWNQPHIGSARARGSITWHSATRVVINGIVNDRCPADGYGAYLNVIVNYRDIGRKEYENVARDNVGCDKVDGVGFSLTYDRGVRIIDIVIVVREMDWTSSPPVTGDHAAHGWLNPYN
jgi:hypothetical protein